MKRFLDWRPSSKLGFHSFDGCIDFGNLGPGTELLSFDFKKHVIAVGCDTGVYIINTFDMHLIILSEDKNNFNIREKHVPQILLKSPPLKIAIEGRGNNIIVKTIEGVFIYELKHLNEPFRSFRGKIKDFDIGMDHLGILHEKTNKFQLFHRFKRLKVLKLPRNTHVSCFSFRSCSICLGLENQRILIFELLRNKCIKRFTVDHPICSIRFLDEINVYVNLFAESNENNQKQQGTIIHTKTGKIFQIRNEIVGKSTENTSFMCHDLKKLNCFCVSSSNSDKIAVFNKEKHLGDWNIFNNNNNNNNNNVCKGFVIDWTWFIPLEKTFTPLLVFLGSDGKIVFRSLFNVDETGKIGDEFQDFIPGITIDMEDLGDGEKQKFQKHYKRCLDTLNNQNNKKNNKNNKNNNNVTSLLWTFTNNIELPSVVGVENEVRMLFEDDEKTEAIEVITSAIKQTRESSRKGLEYRYTLSLLLSLLANSCQNHQIDRESFFIEDRLEFMVESLDFRVNDFSKGLEEEAFYKFISLHDEKIYLLLDLIFHAECLESVLDELKEEAEKFRKLLENVFVYLKTLCIREKHHEFLRENTFGICYLLYISLKIIGEQDQGIEFAILGLEKFSNLKIPSSSCHYNERENYSFLKSRKGRLVYFLCRRFAHFGMREAYFKCKHFFPRDIRNLDISVDLRRPWATIASDFEKIVLKNPKSFHDKSRKNVTASFILRKKVLRFCFTCGVRKNKGIKLQKCGRCKLAFYCCSSHQKQDWKNHKKYCINLKEIKKIMKK